jgi:hypothetical protein
MMSYSNKLHNSSFHSNGGVDDGGNSGDDSDDGLAGDSPWDVGEKMRFLGDVGGDVASATASSEELRWVTCPLA